MRHEPMEARVEMMECDTRQIAAVNASQMEQVDQLMTGELGVSLLQMMELAGHQLASLARTRFFAGDPRGKRIIVLAGSGNNGGGGLAAARRLHGWCATVEVWLSRDPATLQGAATHQLQIVDRLGIPIHGPAAPLAFPGADLIIDALVGYGLVGPPAGYVATLIRTANTQPAPILSLDLPSGLDATSGTVFDPCVRADATLTLAAPKTGLWAAWAHTVTGELYVGDIGVPDAVFARLGLAVGPIFAEQDIVRVG